MTNDEIITDEMKQIKPIKSHQKLSKATEFVLLDLFNGTNYSRKKLITMH